MHSDGRGTVQQDVGYDLEGPAWRKQDHLLSGGGGGLGNMTPEERDVLSRWMSRASG